MANISKIIKDRLRLERELEELTEKFKAQKEQYKKWIDEHREKEQIIADGLDLEKVELGRMVLYVYGNAYGKSDDVRYGGKTIAQCAIEDLLDGCKRLRHEYFGNKVYDGYYQRCDCEYFFGPTHGSICDEIGLRHPEKELTEKEVEAAVYYLIVWQQLPEAKT